MENRLYRALIALLWLALPLSALQYRAAWGRLPAVMATHFGASGQANGWMSRQTALIFTLVLMVFLLATFTWILSRARHPDVLAWSLLATIAVVIGAIASINQSVLNFNLYGEPVNVVPAMLAIFLAAFWLVAVALVSQRGAHLPEDDALAEEVHASPLFAAALLPLLILEVGLMAMIPVKGLRLVLIFPVILVLGAVALAWSGFRYRFTAQGVEISTLGLRLRSIPLREIRSYAAGRWSLLGGYGIRGIGERRAYVWSNRGVRIQLPKGEVFLGHDEPDVIVKDLDLISRSREGREPAQRASS